MCKLISLLFLLVCATPLMAGDQLFDAAVNYEIIGISQYFTKGDFNKDGIEDLAACSRSSFVSVLLSNNDDGAYDIYNHFMPSSGSAFLIDNSDLNSDGYSDLVVFCKSSDYIYVYYNDQSGQFNSIDTVDLGTSTGIGHGGMALDYLNEDSAPDLVLACFSSVIKIFYADPIDIFSPPIEIANANGAVTVACGDIDDDDDIDIVAGNSRGGLVIYTNPFFLESPVEILYHDTIAVYTVTVTDIDLDNDLDVLMGGIAQNSYPIMVLMYNDGLGNLDTFASYVLPDFVEMVHAEDFNGDNYPDVAVSLTGEDTVLVYFNQGDGTLGNRQDYFLGCLDQFGITSVDYDGDNDYDLAVLAPLKFNNICLFVNDGNGEFPNISRPNIPRSRYYLHTMAAADFDKNGWPDLLIGYDSSFVGNLVLYNGTDEFNFDTGVSISGVSSRDIHLSGVYDFNRDDYEDLVLFTEYGDTVFIFLNDQSGNLSLFEQKYAFSGKHEQLLVRDINGDQYLDLITARTSTLDSVFIYWNNGDAAFTDADIFIGDANIASFEVADIDGQNGMDLIIGDVDTYDLKIYINNGDSTFTYHSTISNNYYPQAIAAADLDKDGDLDLITISFSGDLTIYYNSSAIFTESTYIRFFDYSKQLFLYDINKDEYIDILAVNTGGNCVNIFLNDNLGGFDKFVSYMTDDSPAALSIYDLDGDEDDDLILKCNYDIVFLLNNTNTYLSVDDPNRLETLPEEFALTYNYPNPFNMSTVIKFELPRKAYVNISVLNMLGQKVTTLVEKDYRPGTHYARWSGRDAAGNPVASGVYFYKIDFDGVTYARKMLLLK